MSELISFREFARRIKVGEKTIRDAVSLGKISKGVVEENGKKKIDYHEALKEVEAFNLGARSRYGKEIPATSKPNVPGSQNLNTDSETEYLDGLTNESTMAAAQKVEKIAKARLAQLELAERQGLLVRKDEMYRELFSYGTEVRSNILSIPDRITDTLISISNDRNAFNNLLIDSLTEALETFATQERNNA
jgi:hypothetical protein